MRIVRLSTAFAVRNFDQPMRNARTRWMRKGAFLLRVETDDGQAGIGESWCEFASPRALEATFEDDLAPRLAGAIVTTPAEIAALTDALRHDFLVACRGGLIEAAISGLDIALWDLLGKAEGVPATALAGAGPLREMVPVYASGGLYGSDHGTASIEREAAAAAQEGFHAFKLKVGALPAEDDAARIAAARRGLGEGGEILADAVYSLDRAGAEALLRAAVPHRLGFLEAPLPPNDVEGYAALRHLRLAPIAGCEFYHDTGQFRRLLDAGAVDVLHLDAILCGGITGALRVARMAAARGLPVSFHVASSAVAFAANLQVAAATPALHAVEWHRVHRLLFDRLPPDRFVLRGGAVAVPACPGIGVSADEVLAGLSPR